MTLTPQPSLHPHSQTRAPSSTLGSAGLTELELSVQESFQGLFSSQNMQTASHDGGHSQGDAVDELTRLFNSAVVSTRTEKNRDFSAELYQLVQTPAFSAILSAIKLLARSQGLPDHAAAEQIIATFRKLDSVWADYIFQEGVDRLRDHNS